MKVWDFIKGHWIAALSVIGAVIAFFFAKQQFQKGLKAELNNQKTQAKDDVLNERKSVVGENLQKESHNQQALRDKLDKPAPNATMQDVEDFYKNRK